MLVRRSNFKEVIEAFKPTGLYGFDTEATGLYPYNGDRLFSVILSNEEQSFYLNFQKYPDLSEEWILPREWLPQLQECLDNPVSTWAIANAKYDMGILSNEGLEIKGTVHCTEAVGRVVYNRHFTYGLDAAGERAGLGKKQDAVKEYIKKHKLYTKVKVDGKKQATTLMHFEKVPLNIIHPYGERDGELVRKVAVHQINKLAEIQVTMPVGKPTPVDIFLMEKKLTKVCFEMEKVGARVNLDYCREALTHELNVARVAVSDFERISGMVFVDHANTLAKAFDAAGEAYPRTAPTKTRPQGSPSFTADVLDGFDTPLAGIVLKYRRAQKRANTYFRNFIDFADVHERVHANIRQGGTDTGRMSYSEPNLQNVPKTKKGDTQPFPVRRAFIPTNAEWAFFPIDYDQMEYRLMLDYAGELKVIEQVLDGMDIHEATGKMLDLEREKAKKQNFMLIYGGGVQKLATMLGISYEEAMHLKNEYFARLPKIISFVNDVKRVAEQRGFIHNWAGRRCYFPQYRGKDGKLTRGTHAAPNHLIQGGCADVVKKAMIECAQHIIKKKARTRLILQVHDELIFEAPRNEFDLIPELKKIMESVYKFKYLPLTAGIDHSFTSWEDKIKGMP